MTTSSESHPENQPVPANAPQTETEADEIATGDPDRHQSPLRIEEQGLDEEEHS
jgi:hypothetical protein